jgi:hypothetical protein
MKYKLLAVLISIFLTSIVGMVGYTLYTYPKQTIAVIFGLFSILTFIFSYKGALIELTKYKKPIDNE